MKTLIIPCAGKSSRFPDMRPKYLLTYPDGNLMIQKSIEGLKLEQFDRIIITIVKEHDEKYEASLMVKQAFEIETDSKFEVLVLEDFTDCQSETVAKTIKQKNISGPVVIKDSDNFVSLENDEIIPNSVVGINIETFPREIKRLSAKSFLKVNEQGIIVDVIEKQIKSGIICLGIYSFVDSMEFLTAYATLRDNAPDSHEIYISNVIAYMIGTKKSAFSFLQAKEYEDWGTLSDWEAVREKYKTYFVDLDGVLLENKGKYGSKNWSNHCKPIIKNLKIIKDLADEGAQIVITTSREEKYKNQISDLMEKYGIHFHAIVTNCNHASRVLINDFAPTNAYPSCESINIPRNGNLQIYINMKEK